MKKQITYILLLCSIAIYSQDCPNRIGDFIINESTIETLLNSCKYCSEQFHLDINSGEEYLNHEVSTDELDLPYSATSIYELKPDYENLKNWYNVNYVSFNDSTRVFFMPTYETNGVHIKNLILKFHDNKLFYLKASLSKDYFDIIMEKYKGKGVIIADKTTKSKCKLKKNYTDKYFELGFISQEDKVSAKLVLDFKIDSDCDVVKNDYVSIYRFDRHLQELKDTGEGLKKLIAEETIRKEKEKEEKLKKF